MKKMLPANAGFGSMVSHCLVTGEEDSHLPFVGDTVAETSLKTDVSPNRGVPWGDRRLGAIVHPNTFERLSSPDRKTAYLAAPRGSASQHAIEIESPRAATLFH